MGPATAEKLQAILSDDFPPRPAPSLENSRSEALGDEPEAPAASANGAPVVHAPGPLADFVAAVSGPHRPAPEALGDLSTATLGRLQDAAAVALAHDAVHARIDAIEAYWGPLLSACRDGQTTAPEEDLRSVTSQARALSSQLDGALGQALRDRATALEQFFPQPLPPTSKPAPTRYERPITRPAAPVPQAPRPAVVTPEPSRAQRVVLLALVVAALLVAVAPYLTPAPPQTDLTVYQELVEEVLDRRIEGDRLVFVVDPTWARADRRFQQADLTLLQGAMTGEPVNGLALVAPDGRELARNGPHGHIGGESFRR